MPTRSKTETGKGYELYISQLGEVTSCEPLEQNVLYQLRMDQSKWKSRQAGSVQYGVSEERPKGCNLQTELSHSRWKEINYGSAGLMIDSYNYLHFYLDGSLIDTEKIPVSRPCYDLFKLNTRMKVTLLHPILKII
ncbi:uncharacterized protein LOC112576301 [Pomacea canaliculata]|uniref:uncharacterized protein LOC112576301 n=1 Tax=Pomacea canaliculata TaxID=400727 RepID=UPI000D72731D|nr:uncharacterized protein LOC112576301 [Pomacea canaliculata]